MNLIIGVPSQDIVHADFAMSLAMIVHYTISKRPDLNIVAIINEKGSTVQKQRHRIIEQALKLKVDKILFLDSDMVFPPDVIRTLVNWGEDIIGCNYTTRRRPIKPICRKEDKVFHDYKRRGKDEVGYLGTGCLLISTKVFKKIGKPYFDMLYDFEINDWHGEDYSFCKRAREAGYRVYCDNDLSREIGHIGSISCKL